LKIMALLTLRSLLIKWLLNRHGKSEQVWCDSTACINMVKKL
jgi:hypothetical protein